MSNATSTARPTRRSRRQPRVQQGMSDAAISRWVEREYFPAQNRTLTPRNRGDQDSYVPEALPLVDDSFVHSLTSDDEFVGDQGNGTETRSPWNVSPEPQSTVEPDEEAANEYDDFAPSWKGEYGGCLRAMGIRTDQDHFLPIWNGPRIQRFTFVNGHPERIPDPIPTAAAAAPSAAERAGIAGKADSDVVKAAQRAAYATNGATTKVA